MMFIVTTTVDVLIISLKSVMMVRLARKIGAQTLNVDTVQKKVIMLILAGIVVVLV